jgi:hypothetical protein
VILSPLDQCVHDDPVVGLGVRQGLTAGRCTNSHNRGAGVVVLYPQVGDDPVVWVIHTKWIMLCKIKRTSKLDVTTKNMTSRGSSVIG